MEDRYIIMEDKVSKIEKKVEGMEIKLEQIYQRLVGSELFPEGIVKELKDIREELSTLKKFRMKIIYTISGFVALGGFLGYMFNLLYNWLTRK